MSRGVHRPLAALVGCLLLASCTAGSDPGGAGADPRAAATTVPIRLDTPALRALKKQAGIATCRPGTATGELPAVTLACLGGGPGVDLATLRGPMVINLWAQWCGPCRAELPYYQELHRKARGDVAVLGVDFQDLQPGKALTLAGQQGVTYPLLADPAGVLRKGLGVTRGLPGIVFVDRAGNVKPVQFRVFTSYDELRTLVRQQLGVDVPA